MTNRREEEEKYTNQVLIKIQDLPYQKIKLRKKDLSALQKISDLLRLLKIRKKKWLEHDDLDGVYFSVAIRTAELILYNVQFNFHSFDTLDHRQLYLPSEDITFSCLSIKDIQTVRNTDQILLSVNWHKGNSNCPSIQVFSNVLLPIENIIKDTKDIYITEQREATIFKDTRCLVDIAREKKLVDFTKFRPYSNKDEAKWQHAELIKNLNVITLK